MVCMRMSSSRSEASRLKLGECRSQGSPQIAQKLSSRWPTPAEKVCWEGLRSGGRSSSTPQLEEPMLLVFWKCSSLGGSGRNWSAPAVLLVFFEWS